MVGNGGNIGLATGERATARAVTTTSVTMVSSAAKTMHFLALKPPAAADSTAGLAPASLTLGAVAVDPDPGMVTVSPTPAGPVRGTQPVDPDPGWPPLPSLRPSSCSHRGRWSRHQRQLAPATLTLTGQALSTPNRGGC